MGCEDDNTCDQPATKGEIERVYNNLLGFGMVSVGFLCFLIGYFGE